MSAQVRLFLSLSRLFPHHAGLLELMYSEIRQQEPRPINGWSRGEVMEHLTARRQLSVSLNHNPPS